MDIILVASLFRHVLSTKILKTFESILGWPVLLNEVLDTEISNSTNSSNYDQTFHLFIGGNISLIIGQVWFLMARWRSS